MSDRLSCKHCQESLCGRQYIQVEDGPHCISCYDRLHANTCHECQEVIGHNAKVKQTSTAMMSCSVGTFFGKRADMSRRPGTVPVSHVTDPDR